MRNLFNSLPDQTFAVGPAECQKTLTAIFDKSEKIVLFTGRSSADISGAARFVEQIAGECTAELFRWKDIPPEPDIQTVLAMRDFLIKTNRNHSIEHFSDDLMRNFPNKLSESVELSVPLKNQHLFLDNNISGLLIKFPDQLPPGA
jgi:hypothetical protein